MKTIIVSELVNYLKKVGATEVVLESIVDESSKSWTFYWQGHKATLSTPKVKTSIEVVVLVPNKEYEGISEDNVTGLHYHQKAFIEKVLTDNNIFFIS
jgi:hypothetical protein